MAAYQKLAIDLKKKLSDTKNKAGDESTLNVLQFKRLFECYLFFNEMIDEHPATKKQNFCSISRVVMHQIVENWLKTKHANDNPDAKRICYLSFEYNMGRSLKNHLMNLNLSHVYTKAMEEFSLNSEEIESVEEVVDVGIGEDEFHSVCFLDSLATLKIPAYCYGLRFDYNSFTQKIVDGIQYEKMHYKTLFPNPWEKKQPEYTYPIQFYGEVVSSENNSRLWRNAKIIQSTAYDTPITGFRNNVVNTLRLWSAKCFQDYNTQFSSTDEYIQTMCEISDARNITAIPFLNYKVSEMLLKQEYLLASATLQDIIRYFNYLFSAKENTKFSRLPEKIAIHINDTYPSLIIPELMRVLLDKEKMSWVDAWNITTKVCSYTCHDVDFMSLERWPLDIFGKLLPRHLEIIREIDKHFHIKVKQKWPNDKDKQIRMSLIEENNKINMAHLAIVGSHTVNTVSNMHMLLLKYNLFKEFFELWPEKFINITNGVSPRQWLLACSPSLADVINECLESTKWVYELQNLNSLYSFTKNEKLKNEIENAKHNNKAKLISHLKLKYDIKINPDSMIDVLTFTSIRKRKRYLLKCLHVVVLYNRIIQDPHGPFVPRTILFGGKAAPTCIISKRIINFIYALAKRINHDPRTVNKLKVIFLKNYNTSYANQIIPAADLNENLAPAGSESFGVNYIISMLNGTLNIGSQNGVYLEIKTEVGSKNTFIFGKSHSQLIDIKRKGYNAREYFDAFIELKEAIKLIENKYFGNEKFSDLIEFLMKDDEYFTLADFESYIKEQGKVDSVFLNRDAWLNKMIVNIAASGRFSSDRTVAEYAKNVWKYNL